MHVGEGERGSLGQLTLQARAGLLHVGRPVGGRDGVNLRRDRRSRAARGQAAGDSAQAGAAKTGWIADGGLDLALGGAVQHFQVHQVSHRETIVEEAKTSAQNGLGYCALLVAVKGVCKSHTRSPVAVIRNVILRLPAQAAGEREILVDRPIVLVEERGGEDIPLEGIRPGCCR